MGVVDRDLPRFPLIFLEHASAFFFFLASFIQNEEEVERGRSPVVARFLELGEKSNGEKRRGGKAKNRETGPGSSDIQLDLRLHKLRIRVCSWIPYIRH